jgi:hypothetical protein
MPVEVYYAPIIEAATITLDDLLKELTAAGLPCKVEPESAEIFWVVLDDHESTLLASVNGGHLVFGTFEYSLEDDTTVMDKVNEVMLKSGYSAGEDSSV